MRMPYNMLTIQFKLFQANVHFYNPWKCQKNFGFQIFSGVVEMERLLKMDLFFVTSGIVPSAFISLV